MTDVRRPDAIKPSTDGNAVQFRTRAEAKEDSPVSA